MILEFSSEAENDLEHIADYIARDDPQRALSFVRELRSKCERLLNAPHSFAFVPRFEHHGIRLRCTHDTHNNIGSKKRTSALCKSQEKSAKRTQLPAFPKRTRWGGTQLIPFIAGGWDAPVFLALVRLERN